MKKRTWALGFALAGALTAADLWSGGAMAPREASAEPARYALQEAWPGVSFDQPIDLAYLPDGAWVVRYRTWPYETPDKAPPAFIRWMEEFTALDQAMRDDIMRNAR